MHTEVKEVHGVSTDYEQECSLFYSFTLATSVFIKSLLEHFTILLCLFCVLVSQRSTYFTKITRWWLVSYFKVVTPSMGREKRHTHIGDLKYLPWMVRFKIKAHNIITCSFKSVLRNKYFRYWNSNVAFLKR